MIKADAMNLYPFLISLIETIIVVVLVNRIVHHVARSEKYQQRLMKTRWFIYVFIVFLVVLSSYYFLAVGVSDSYWRFLVIAATATLVYIAYNLYKWVIGLRSYSAWFDIQVRIFQTFLSKIFTYFAVLPLRDVAVIKSIRAWIIRELKFFDKDFGRKIQIASFPYEPTGSTFVKENCIQVDGVDPQEYEKSLSEPEYDNAR